MIARIAINGFGRIGRNALKIALQKDDLEVVVVNDLSSARILAHLLKYDSAFGVYEKEVQVEEGGRIVETETQTSPDNHLSLSTSQSNYILVGGKRIKVINVKDPQDLPWKDLNIDLVLECTGRFTNGGDARAHLTSGAKRVIVSAPVKGGNVATFLFGVNSDKYRGQEIISNASCTTNCVSPVAAIIQSQFGIVKASMTTIHAYTVEQNLVDSVPPPLHTDLRRARAAAFNIVPTTTGAAASTTEIIPELEGLFDGFALRVPVIDGSLSDFTFLTKRKVGVEEVNQAFIKAKDEPFYRGILDVSLEPLVSSDIIGSTFSATVDLSLTKVIDGDLLKVVAWYDNEWGYSNRLVEMAQLVAKSIPV